MQHPSSRFLFLADFTDVTDVTDMIDVTGILLLVYSSEICLQTMNMYFLLQSSPDIDFNKTIATLNP